MKQVVTKKYLELHLKKMKAALAKAQKQRELQLGAFFALAVAEAEKIIADFDAGIDVTERVFGNDDD